MAICKMCKLLKDCPYKKKDETILGCSWDIGELGLHVDAERIMELWGLKKTEEKI